MMNDNHAAVLVLAMMLGVSAASSCSSVRDEMEKDIDIETPIREADDIKVIPGRLRVKFSEKVEPRISLLSAVGATRMERVFPYAGKFEARTHKEGLDRWYNVWYDEAVPVTKAAGELEKTDGIEVVEKVLPVKRIDFGEPVTMLPMGVSSSSEYPVDDPYLPKQWHYHNDGSRTDAIAGADINLFRAWEVTSGSNDVVVAVVDGGIDYAHEDLAGNVGNWAELYGQEGVDDDNNGLVDDIYGWKFIYTDRNPMGDNKITAVPHGTHVAGTIGAENNNGKGVCGIAGGSGNHSGVRLLSCQMFTNNKNDDGDSDAAIKYGADAGAVISQNSWGYDGATYLPQSCQEAIDYFIKYAGIDENGNQVGPMKGGIVIFAAGNDDRNYLSYPACYDQVLSVASVAPDYRKAYYSNYAKWVDVAAPGGTYRKDGRYDDECPVYSTLPDNRYGYMQGTSMACPHVSGIAALAVSKYGGPGFTPDKLKLYLTRGVNNVDAYNPGYKGLLGSGAVDAYKAVSSDQGYAPDRVVDLQNSNTAGEVELTWTVPEDKDDEHPDTFLIMWRVGTLDKPDPENLPEGASLVRVPVNGKKSGDKMSYTLLNMDQDTRYTVAIIAEDPWMNRSPVSSISFGTPVNEPPVLSTDAVQPVQVAYNRRVRVTCLVTDPDSKDYTYELTDPSGAVTPVKEKGKLHLDIFNYKRTPGSYSLHVTVSDRFGASDSADLRFDLLPDQAPVVVNAFAPVYLGSMKETSVFLPSSAFEDEVPETVKYSLSCDRSMLFLQELPSGEFSIMPLKFGRSEVEVTAVDEGGNVSKCTFAVLCRDDSREVDLYPNPVKDIVHIRMGRNVKGQVNVSVYDAAARRVLTADVQIAPTEPASVDMSSLGGGNYTVRISWDGGSLVRTVVKL